MLTLKWIIGLVCLLYPSRVEGGWQPPLGTKKMAPENATGEDLRKGLAHADQMTCGTGQALIAKHVT